MSHEKLLQQTDEPAFILDRRRRVRFVNRAWERLTGLGGDAIVGLSCARQREAPTRTDEKTVALAMRPPPEVMDGKPGNARRAAPPEKVGPPWWDVAFFPLTAEGRLVAVFGKITVVGEKRPKDSPERLAEPLMELRQRTARRFTPELLGGDGPLVRRLAAQVRAACAGDAPVWIHGAPGVGKRTVARIIHHQGPHRDRTFAAIDCRFLPPAVIRGTLFGRSGLATSPRLGTLYLREPGELPGDLQTEILAWLGDRESAPPRVLAGSQQSAAELGPEWAAELGVIEIRVPSLNEHSEDIAGLAYRLLENAGPTGGLSPEVAEVLARYPWPGNLRELSSVLRSAASESGGDRVEVKHLPRWLREEIRHESVPPAEGEPFLNLDLILEQVERRLIDLALKQTGGNQTEAANRLGIWRARLGRRIDALKIEVAKKK